MQFPEMRKSLKQFFGFNSIKPVREPLIFDDMVYNLRTESNLSEGSENRFSIINRKPPKLNQFYVALDQLKQIYKNQPKTYDCDQLDVIQYNDELPEKKVNLKMSNARWNQFNEQESLYQSLFQSEILVEKKNPILESVIQQEIQPYYAKQDQNSNKSLLQSQIRIEPKIQEIKKSEVNKNGGRSRLNFSRGFNERKSQSKPPESNFKRLGGILDEDFCVPSFFQDDLLIQKQSSKSQGTSLERKNISSFNQSKLSEKQFSHGRQNEHSLSQINEENENCSKNKKKSSIKFESCVSQEEINPFILQNQGEKCPPWQKKSSPSPWLITQQQQIYQSKIEDKNSELQQEFKNKQNQSKSQFFKMIQKNNYQELSRDSFCAQTLGVEAQSPLQVEVSQENKSEFQEQTPVFKQNEDKKFIKTLYSASKQKQFKEDQQMSPKNENYFRSVKGENQKYVDVQQKQKKQVFEVQEQQSNQQKTSQLQVNQ